MRVFRNGARDLSEDVECQIGEIRIMIFKACFENETVDASFSRGVREEWIFSVRAWVSLALFHVKGVLRTKCYVEHERK